jgi:hypothetical protein
MRVCGEARSNGSRERQHLLSAHLWNAAQGPGSTSPLVGVIVGILAAAGAAFAFLRRRWLWAQMGMADPPEAGRAGRWMYLLSAVGVPIVFMAIGVIFVCVRLVSL